MKLYSVSVMASQEREHFFPYLKEKLCDVPFSVDAPRNSKENIGIWQNCKKAWSLHDKNAKYHLVIQDDAIICDDFYDHLESFIEKIEKEKPDDTFAFQLFLGNRPSISDDDKKNGYIIHNHLHWGVAIMLPTEKIESVLKYAENYPSNQDDTKIKYSLIHHGIKTVFPIPCLIDHRKMNESPTLTLSPDSDRYSPYFIDKQKVNPEIPKVIHQIWIGDPSLMPKSLMDTWKKDGWEYKLWTEKEIDDFGLKNRKLYDFFYNKKCYFGCSDIVRIEVLNKYGGVYIDADTECYHDISELLYFINNRHEKINSDLIAIESNKEGRISNSVIGSIPNHPILKNYIREVGIAKKVEPVWDTIGGTMFTEMIGKYLTDKTKIHKARTFYPFDSKGKPAAGNGKVYARHYWHSTHNNYGKN